MGRSCSSMRLMLREVSSVLLCGFLLVGRMAAQEVVVAREAKAETREQPTPPPEQPRSESPTQTENKPRKKKAASRTPTLEEMRMAGALAAERLDKEAVPQSDRTAVSDNATPAASTQSLPVAATPAKKESRHEQTSTPRRSSSRSAKPEPVGAIRPTMMDSGREEPSATPSPSR
jgi:hypothetical protein